MCSKGFFSFAELNMYHEVSREMNQRSSKVNLNSPRLPKTRAQIMPNWCWDDAKMLNPLEPKCLMGHAVLKPRASMHLYSWCWVVERSDAGVVHALLLCTMAGKAAWELLFIIAHNLILFFFFQPLAKMLLGISLVQGIVRVIWLSRRKTPTCLKHDKYFISWKCNQL